MRKLLLTLTACLCVLGTWADLPFRNHRYDSFKALQPAEGSILFIGNSITDMHCWPEVFKTSEGKYLPIVNRGNSGTYSTEQSDNLESYLANKPKKVFMMIGTNDIATSGGLNFSPEQVLAYVKSIVARIHARSPQTKVYLYSILNNKTGNRVESTWLKANQLTKAYADATDKVTYVDLYDKLTNVADGGQWSYDNLHLTAGAYQAWAKEICQYLQEGEDYTISTAYPDNTLEKQNNGGLGGANGMRATYFSMLPISENDVLVFGDEFIKNGEWQELLGNPNVKNRGTGWGYGGDIATTSKLVDATYANTGVEKKDAKAIFLYTGTGDANGTTDLETVKANYKALVDKLKQKSPTSVIYVMSLCPTNNAGNNTSRISVLNAYLKTLEGVKFVDFYNTLLNGNVANTKYFYPSNYLGALGYVEMAQAMKEALAVDFPQDKYTVIDDATAEARYAQAGLRNQLTQVIARGLIATRGNAAGQYNEEKMKAFDAKMAEANALLERNDITQEQVTEFANALNAILNEALSMPTNSTEGNEVWYQLYTPNRNSKYMTSTGAGAGVVGEDKHNYATGMWKFVARQDGKVDIVNRADKSYLAPTAAYNAQITTSATQPANGWTLSYANTPGLFIISSGTVQLNQTTLSGTPVYNWSNEQTGTDRADTGCQYQIELVEGEPDVMPEPDEQTLTLTLTPAEHFANGKSTYTKHVSSSDGWYGKFVTGTTPALTCESTDMNANNIGWSQNRPWLKAGYTYNLTLPQGYEFVGYDLTTLSTSSGYSGTYTYTTADGTATSQAQSNGTAKTVTANGLSTNKIVLTVGGTAGGSNYGILIAKMVIRYKAVENEEELPLEVVYTIDKQNGDLYRDNGQANQSWNHVWKSHEEPQLQFGCGPNNMNWAGNNIQLMTGGSNCRYTLTAPSGYVITEYSFTYANNGHDNAQEILMDNGAVYTTSTTAKTVSAQKQRLTSLVFDLKGPNGKGVVLSNFTVKVRQDIAELPVISTEGNEYWYYITSASTQAYCAGKVMYYDSQVQKMRFGDKEFKPTHVWSFWEKDGKLAIKNYNGEYFGTAGSGSGNSTAFGVVSEPNYIYYINEAHGFFVIKDNAVELHAQDDNKVIVRWGAAAGNASLWRFNEVDLSNAEASVASTRVVQGKVSTGIGNVDQAIIRSTIRVAGLEGKVNFQGVKGAFFGTSKADVTNVKAYFATNDRELFVDAAKKMTWREENGVQFGQAVTLAEDGTFTITGTKDMAPGDYYLWIAYDIAETAKEGNLVDASITSYTVDGAEIEEANGNPKHSVTVFLSEGSVLMPMDKGSLHYRIPAITATKDGKRLVVLTDDRKQSQADLPNHCYVVAQYSDDNGKTWSDPLTVAGTPETGGNYGHGDASIVTNRDNGEIVGIMTSAGTYGHGFFQGTATEPPRWKTITSRDGGVTWDAPVDHTDDLFGAKCDNPKTQTWKSGFSGSGAALQKRDGTLVSSFVNREADNSQNFYFFMSKDGGQNWYVSGTSGTKSADEPKTLERNNGDLAISVRASGYNYHNVTSDDGETWHYPSQTRFTTGISGNACDGEYMVWCSTLEGNPWNIALQTLPNSGSRENVSIALSTDEGETFGSPKTICPRGSCYSATVVLPDGTLGVYYEENGVSDAFVMRFVRFSLDWASNGTYKFTEENPFYPIKSTNETGIDELISTPETNADNTMYDLQGRRVLKAASQGVYIQNGKKVFISR
ncbi:MAG: exo-alpha-sialidase [Bacteroidaceae bacterium]|nr:exo-alpha-sialidase [Bacteroidaceae bacterium]